MNDDTEYLLAAKLDSPLAEGRTFGRALANSAATMYLHERDRALAAARALRRVISDMHDIESYDRIKVECVIAETAWLDGEGGKG